MSPKAMTRLQVIGVRYRRSTPASGDERALDAYLASNVYDAARVPVDIFEPNLAPDAQSHAEIENLGLLGGIIADVVGTARRKGNAILMTGGDCTHVTGVLGGLQDVHGPAARIGLVWFDAHGDFNTPQTTLSGMLGGMPVAVCAGLAHPLWRERSHIAAPLPTDRILMVDVRNLDPLEEQLLRATDVVVAAPAPGFPGADLDKAVAELAGRCDMLYLHIDSDILDVSFVPNHGTREPNGPNLEQVQAAIDVVMKTGQVVAFAVVSVYGEGQGNQVSVASGIQLIRSGLESWRLHGLPALSDH
jgi:arginase